MLNDGARIAKSKITAVRFLLHTISDFVAVIKKNNVRWTKFYLTETFLKNRFC